MNGEQLKKKIAGAGYSGSAVAKLIGMSQQGFSQALNSQDIKSGLIEKVAAALNMPVSYFIESVPNNSDDTTNGSHSSQAVGDGAMATNSEGVKECLEIIKKQQESIDKLVDAIAALSHSGPRT